MTGCLCCGQPVPPARRARPRRFCSDACRLRFHRRRRNKASQVAAVVAWAHAHPTQKAAQRRRWKQHHRDAVRQAAQRWYRRHVAAIQARHRNTKWWTFWRARFGGSLTATEQEILAAYRAWQIWRKSIPAPLPKAGETPKKS